MAEEKVQAEPPQPRYKGRLNGLISNNSSGIETVVLMAKVYGGGMRSASAGCVIIG